MHMSHVHFYILFKNKDFINNKSFKLSILFMSIISIFRKIEGQLLKQASADQ